MVFLHNFNNLVKDWNGHEVHDRFEECNFHDCNIYQDISNFINFDHVSYLQNYRMKFIWDDFHTLEWTQELNPLEVSKRDLNVCANNGCLSSPKDTEWKDFVGLSKSDDHILSGTIHKDYYTIGYDSDINTAFRYTDPDDERRTYMAVLTKLFVFLPKGSSYRLFN